MLVCFIILGIVGNIICDGTGEDTGSIGILTDEFFGNQYYDDNQGNNLTLYQDSFGNTVCE